MGTMNPGTNEPWEHRGLTGVGVPDDAGQVGLGKKKNLGRNLQQSENYCSRE